ALRQGRVLLGALEQRGYLQPAANADDRDALINEAVMGAVGQFDETMRALALQRYREFEAELSPVLTRFVVADTVRRFRAAGQPDGAEGVSEEAAVESLVRELTPQFGPWLARNPVLEDVTKITQRVADRLAQRQAFAAGVEPADALALDKEPFQAAVSQTAA